MRINRQPSTLEKLTLIQTFQTQRSLLPSSARWQRRRVTRRLSARNRKPPKTSPFSKRSHSPSCLVRRSSSPRSSRCSQNGWLWTTKTSWRAGFSLRSAKCTLVSRTSSLTYPLVKIITPHTLSSKYLTPDSTRFCTLFMQIVWGATITTRRLKWFRMPAGVSRVISRRHSLISRLVQSIEISLRPNWAKWTQQLREVLWSTPKTSSKSSWLATKRWYVTTSLKCPRHPHISRTTKASNHLQTVRLRSSTTAADPSLANSFQTPTFSIQLWIDSPVWRTTDRSSPSVCSPQVVQLWQCWAPSRP